MDKERRAARNEMFSHPYYAQCNSEYKSLQYCRYADDFIIGVIGSKQDAEQIKADVKRFLAEELKLTLSEEKTKITHTSEFARFLGYDICISRSNAIKYNGKGVAKREYSGRVMMYVPKEKWVGKLQEYHAFKIVTDENGKEKWKTVHRGKLINHPDTMRGTTRSDSTPATIRATSVSRMLRLGATASASWKMKDTSSTPSSRPWR